MEKKRVLTGVYTLDLKSGHASLSSLAELLGLGEVELSQALDVLVKEGMLETSGGELHLTDRGREAFKAVFIGGGFEVIHAGHLHTISEAKRLGDVLVVVVARDTTIRKRKGREPITPEGERLGLVSSLRPVDVALLGGTGNIYDMLERVKPDVVALGYDQYHGEEQIASEAAKRGLRIKVVRLGSPRPELKTTKLLQET